MTTPTPEQVAAAKAKLSGRPMTTTHIHELTQLISTPHETGSDIAARILLAALEAAEQDSARLDWLEKGGALPSFVKGIWYGRGAQGYTEHNNLRAAIDVTKEAQP